MTTRAATELEEAAEGLRRVVGPLHRDTLRHRRDLGQLWARMGEHRAAVDLLADVLAAQRSVLAETRTDVAATRAALTGL